MDQQPTTTAPSLKPLPTNLVNPGGSGIDWVNSLKSQGYDTSPLTDNAPGGKNYTPPSPTNQTPAVTQPMTPGQPVDTSQPGTKPTSVTPQTGANTQTPPTITTVAQAKAAGAYDKINGPGSYAEKYKAALGNAQGSGKAAPQSAGAGSAGVQGNLPPPPAQEPAPNPIDNTLKQDPGYQQLLADHTDHLNSLNQRDTLTKEYQSLSKSLGLSDLNTQLMDMKKVIDGTEDDIRTEVTKAGGFATESQVMAMSSARNKVMIQNYNNLLQTKQDAQTQLTTLIGLSEKDRAQADQQFNEQMQYDQKVSDYRDKAVTNAKNAFDKIISAPGYGYKALYSSTGGDPTAVANTEQTLGLQPGMLKTLASQAPAKDLQYISGTANQSAGTFDKTTGKFTPLAGGGGKGGAGSGSTTSPASSGATSATGAQIPSTLTPYLNTSSSGVQYIDASTLQGTAKDKTNLINQASAAGLKVITNKNTAADLVNIQDANSKLNTVQGIMTNLAQPDWLSRTFGGLGLTKLETMTQSDPQKAAAGALQSIGLDMLKAISGVQGFRGNQTAIQQVSDHLPKITDTKDTVNQKISYIKKLISDRENAALGTTKNSTSSNSTENTHVYNGVNYKLINGTWTPQ